MKRLLALLLAAVMAISLLPSAALAAEDHSLKYVFNYTAAGKSADTTLAAGIGSAEGAQAAWGTVRKPLGFGTYALYKNYLMLTQSKELNGAMFKITVDEEHMYMPSVSYRTRNRGGLLEMYLISEATAEANSWNMAKVDFEEIYDAAAPLDNTAIDAYVNDPGISAEAKRHNFRGITLTPGSYYLIFRINGTNEKVTHAKPQAFVDSFALETAENCLQYVQAEAPKSIEFGKSAEIDVRAYRLDSTEIPEEELTISYSSSEPGLVAVTNDGKITGCGIGESKITVTVSDGRNTVSETVSVSGADNSKVSETSLSAPSKMYVTGKSKLVWKATLESGNILIIPFENVGVSLSEEGFLSVAKDGTAEALAETEEPVTVTLSTEFRGEALEKSFDVTVGVDGGKTAPTYYTYEKRANAQNNAKEYDWAKKEADSAAKAADAHLQNIEAIYDSMAGEGIPRSNHIGYLKDPTYTVCKYCKVDVTATYGSGKMGGWNLDVVTRPWKIQCPGCKRIFPSNDFGSLYKLGIGKGGHWSYADAMQKHHELFVCTDEECSHKESAPDAKNDRLSHEWMEYYGYGKGYLKNTTYNELSDTVNMGQGLRPGESIDTWGVDDGFGYVPLDENGNTFKIDGIEECHAYIPYYMAYAWKYYEGVINDLADAYLYTGDIKYGRAGAILLDRVADFFPYFNSSQYKRKYHISCGGSKLGHIHGRIQDSTTVTSFALACDAFFPAASDSEVTSFLSRKAAENGSAQDNAKDTGDAVWKNWEENILMVIPTIIKAGRALGNEGLYQRAMATAAIVLDREPYTTEMIEWIYAEDDIDTTYKDYNTDTCDDSIVTAEGGGFGTLLVNKLDRDGIGNESSVAYNIGWLGKFSKMADVLSAYTGEKSYNPYENPKFVSMFTGFIPLVTANSQSANIGDNVGVAQNYIGGSKDEYIRMFNLVEDEATKKKLAEYLYLANGCSFDGINNDIFSEDAGNLGEELEKYVGSEPTLPSKMMTGYGFAILRGGANHRSASEATANNTLRDFWMYFGGFVGHGHGDALNLGIESFGLNIAPDLGYAEEAGTDPMRLQWIGQTISHNLVVVDGEKQTVSARTADPIEFDDGGKVKFMDISAADRYPQAEEYRRALVMVEVDDNVSYGVDFFRVKGGDKHTYSFHSQAENAYASDGLEMTAQVAEESGEYELSYWNESAKYVTEKVYKEKGEYIGSYASPSHEPGQDPDTTADDSSNPRWTIGYSWLGKVRRDTEPEKQFSVEFDVEDYRKLVKDGSSIALRVTQMNDFAADEVALVSGPVPNRSENKNMPSTLDYMLVQREGENLDSLFTTVYEPYRGSRYIESMEAFTPEVSEESEAQPGKNDVARAVKVSHKNGRTDYVVYATNTSVTYDVAGEFSFRGAAGVLSRSADGTVIYRYVCDGDIIGGATEASARVSGTVTGFSEELTRENYIDVALSGVTPAELAGRYIYIDNDGVQNGVYGIESASDTADGLQSGELRLYLGDVTPIRSYRDSENLDAGFKYNIAEGQSFMIPMSFTDSGAPEVDPVSSVSVSAGSSVSVNISARTDSEGVTLSYIGTTLPRGASLNEASGVFTWKPDSSQVGDNHVAVTVRDSDGRESTVHFTVTVYGSTTGSPSGSTDNSGASAGSTGTSGGGGGGGGGGATPSTPDTEDESLPIEGKVPSGDEADDVETTRFTDLGNHPWAADAINALANDGIVKGTTATTYSPAANITRADFALLLVRAFDLTSDNTENFADVSADDYFASELAVARNTGIVNGIGANLYAPRNSITRQDMMVIVYRAITTLGKMPPLPKGRGTVEDGGGIPAGGTASDTEQKPSPVGEGRPLAVDEALLSERYSDWDTAAPYAHDAVEYLISAGIVNGKSGKIAPTDFTTRAEVAVLLGRILDFTK